jgi:hypothetical protein
MHNYSGANSVRQKMYNWATLNQKVFRRLGFLVDKPEIDAVVGCKPGAVELLLMRLQRHIAEMRRTATSPSGIPALMDLPAAAGGAGAGAAASAYGGSDGSMMQPRFDGAGVGSGAAAPAGGVGGAAVGPRGVAAGAGGVSPAGGSGLDGVDAAIIAEKDATIGDLRETIEILELKIKKLEQVRVWFGIFEVLESF